MPGGGKRQLYSNMRGVVPIRPSIETNMFLVWEAAVLLISSDPILTRTNVIGCAARTKDGDQGFRRA